MEQKINIAQLLRDCPQGMELDCPMFENLEFDYVDINPGTYPIVCRVKTEFGIYNNYTFTEYGCYRAEKYSKCVIFPKGKTTWEGFVPPCKFKVGDNIRMKGTAAIYVVTAISEDCYMLDDKDISLLFKNQNQWELVPNKFDINTLVPFESKVLVRDGLSSKWLPAIWGFYNEDGCDYHYEVVGGNSFSYCIPYEGNEHLRGTTNDCDDYYKDWE